MIDSKTTHAFESETFNLVIQRKGGSQILLLSQRDRYLLPQIAIPKWHRVAESVTEGVANLLKLRSLCLFQPDLGNGVEAKYIVLEPRDYNWQPAASFEWVPLEALNRNVPCDFELPVLEEILKQCEAYNTGELKGPFARAGWFDDVLSWAQEMLDPLDVKMTGGFRQFNCGPHFNLVRIETNARAYWFKAVPESNVHEYGITISLSRHGRRYVPRVIAAREPEHAWLMEEANGVPLREIATPEAWHTAAMTLGAMQGDLVDDVKSLLAAGCMDFRTTTLVSKIDPFFEFIEGLMLKQISTPPAILGHIELRQLARDMTHICHRLDELGIPDSLGHGDLNTSNIIVGERGATFIDWATAYVGNPLPTFEYLRLGYRKRFPDHEAREDPLETSYAKGWERLRPTESIRRALSLTPPLAAFLAALTVARWRVPEDPREPEIAKWLRSLTRKIQLEMQRLRTSGVLCTAI